jgi:Protein of unknown function (DUF1573)
MKKGIFAAAVCLGVVYGLTAVEEAPKDTKATSGKPKIKFDQTVYDFGKTSQVERVSGTFRFQNVGDGVLKVGKPTASCGCTVAGVKPDVLQPGEKGELSFTLNLGRTRALLQKQITVDSNDPDSPKTLLTVKADYTPLYDVMPVSFFFNLRKGETTNITAKVTRTDGKPFTVAKIKPTQTWIEAKAELEPNSTNQSVRITATLKPEGSPRYFSEFLNVFVDESEQPAFNVTFSGRLLGDLTMTPESLYWPITDPDKALTTRRIVVKSSLPDKLEVKNVSSTLKDLNLEAVPKEDGKTLELVAKLISIPDRTTNGVIRFETNVPSQPKVEVPVWINVIKK